MLGSLATWTSALDNLPKVTNSTWRANLANAVDDLVTGKLEIAAILGTTSAFTFGKSDFQTELASCVATSSTSEAAGHFADAWAAGMSAATWSVSVGAYVGTSSPATTYGSVNSAGVPSPPTASTVVASITSARAGLVSAITSLEPSNSSQPFAEALRNAFLAVTANVNGYNAIPYAPPSTYPAPLTVVNGSTK
jgi:hypothetical protein